jgi:hypothetical protein
MSSRRNSSNAPNMWNYSRPDGVEVSMPCFSTRRSTSRAELGRQVQQMAQRTGRPGKAGDDEGVTGPEVVQRLVELGTAVDLP